MSIKFYNSNTEFLTEELVDDNNVIFDDDIAPATTRTAEEIETETEVITDDLEIKTDEIQFIDDEPKFNREITITKSIENKYIQYTDDQFKNNLLLLCKSFCSADNKISNINNLLKIYKKISIKKL